MLKSRDAIVSADRVAFVLSYGRLLAACLEQKGGPLLGLEESMMSDLVPSDRVGAQVSEGLAESLTTLLGWRMMSRTFLRNESNKHHKQNQSTHKQ